MRRNISKVFVVQVFHNLGGLSFHAKLVRLRAIFAFLRMPLACLFDN